MVDKLYGTWCILLGATIVLSTPAMGQLSAPGIDCIKARSPIERALCANPALMELDRATAQAYGDMLTRAPTQRDALRLEQLHWIKQRDAACALPGPAIAACLKNQLTARIAALAPPAITAVPDQPTLPAIPSTRIPEPEATLDSTSLPAAAQAETMLHVTRAGRFTLSATSPSGAALQLVDMLTGPSDVAGAAGSQNGRIDELLDVGVYKLLVFSAPEASGLVSVAVRPFHDAAPPSALPLRGQALTSTLADGEQRAFWLAIPTAGPVRIEAAGRSLSDLRLWRDGRELTPLLPEVTPIEPVPGHPLTDMQLTGSVEAGTYLVTAYGGRAANWTNNDDGQPFHIRSGVSDALEVGWTGGVVGPFGSEFYRLPPATGLLRLELPQAQQADLLVGDRSAEIKRESREPAARLLLAPDEKRPVELRAAQGQAFTLRAMERPTASSVTKPGTYWLSALADGAGGDEVPPTLLLVRDDGSAGPGRIVADTLPTIGPGAGWRGRFNLRGPTTLLAHSLGGPVELRTTGVPVRSDRNDANLPAGYFAFLITPQPGAIGAVEVTIGPQAVTPPLAAALPGDPVLPFGVQALGPHEQFRLIGNAAPGLTLGLSARPAPVVLAEGPLSITLSALASAEVPVVITPGGTLEVSEVGRGPIPYTSRTEPGGTLVSLPPADHARTVVLAWRQNIPTAIAIPAPPPPDQDDMQAGTPVFFDLAAQASTSYGLSVATGGLYRIETTGRLRTAGRLGTAFLPDFKNADANGIGQNMLIQTMLRAGRYRVAVTAEDSAGHAGLTATPATLLTTALLQPGGTVRASLPTGTGAAIPIEVSTKATLHLDVLGLGTPWAGRLEDAQGWPITQPGPLDGTEQAMAAGKYRLVVEPATTARDLVVRLRTVAPVAVIVGHGPHPLPFGTAQSATWREPDSQSAPRTPDQWRFALEGSAAVTLHLDNTMVGTLNGPAGLVRRVVGRWHGTLPPGNYTLDVMSLGRNDRADYTVALDSAELQPDAPRQVTLPATLPFAIAASRVVNLTSFGTTPVRAILRDAKRRVIGRYGPRDDDWNIAVSRPLQPGTYTLELAPAAAPTSTQTAQRDPPPTADSDAASDPNSDAASDRTSDSATSDPATGDAATADADSTDPTAQTSASQTENPNRPAQPSDTDAQTASADDTAPAATVEIRLALPPALDPAPAPESVAALEGHGVHVLSLPPVSAGKLLVVQAQSAAALVLTLERRAGPAWRVVALDQGRAPIVAAPGDADPASWRVQAWLVDGGAEPVRAVARIVSATAQPPGTIDLAPMEAMAAPLAVARVILPPGLASVHAGEQIVVGSRAGHGLAPSPGAVLPVAGDLWLLGPAGTAQATPLLPAAGETVALTVPGGAAATLPASAPIGLWLARSGEGQPSLGAATGWAPGSAIALTGSELSLRGGAGPLRVDLQRVGLEIAPSVAVDTGLQVVLAAGAAVPVTLPPGPKRLDLALAADTGAVPGWHAPQQAVWAGNGPVSRSITGDWTDLLLVNPGPAPASVTVSAAPAPVRTLAPGEIETRFFGAAGSFEVGVRGATGSHLRLTGPGALTLIDGEGRITTGANLALTGPGRAIVRHAPGAVALWIEAPGASPWPDIAPQQLAAPARVALSGPAAAFALHLDRPMLLHISTTAPVLLGVGADQPAPYPSGAEIDRVLAAGDPELRLYPLQDGALTGTLAIRTAAIVAVGEGLGPETIVPPGGGAAFGFTLDHAATIGVGLRADPDRATARLLDATGRTMGTGIAELVALQPGHYVLEAQLPPNAPVTTLRPAVVGLVKHGDGPPPDVVRDYLELAGLKPQGATP